MEYLSVQDAARLLKVSPITVRRHIAAGQLRAVRVGKGIRVPQDAIEAYLRPVREPVSRIGGGIVVYEVRPGAAQEVDPVRMQEEVRKLIPPLTPKENQDRKRAFEEMDRLREEDKVRRGGRPYPPSYLIINEERDKRTRRLMGDEE